MLNQPQDQAEAARKFNTALDEVLAHQEDHYILDVNEVLIDISYFNNEKLNGFGKVKFWREIDHQLELFDYKRISLLPSALQKAKNFEDSRKNMEEKVCFNKTTRGNNYTNFRGRQSRRHGYRGGG